MFRIALSLAVFFAATGCERAVGTDLTRPDAEPRGSITILHDYPLQSSWKSYIAAFNQMRQAEGVLRTSSGAASTSASTSSMCLQDQSRSPGTPLSPVAPNAARSSSASATNDPYTLGVVQVWATKDPYTWPTFSLYYPIPVRFLGHCTGWRYGWSTYASEEGESADPYGIEEVDDPPAEPPPGMTAEDWLGLNPAEKRLVWKKFLSLSPDLFAVWLQMMQEMRRRAEEWARETWDEGARDGIQDALRHAYWQCTMTKAFGAFEAREWGDAHEKYNLQSASARMDLHNNAAGRKAAALNSDCALGVREAWDDGRLQVSLNAPTAGITPFTPPPPPPGFDQ